MWKRKELKSRARQVVKKNYWTAIVICFLIALLTGEFGTSILGIYQQEDSMNPYYIFMHKDEIADENTNNNNEQQLQQEQEIITKMEEKKESLSDIELKIWNAIEANLDSITKSQKYVFKISDAIKYFNLNEMTSGIVLSIMAIISIAFTIIIANPLVVAGKRYFIKAREKSSTLSVSSLLAVSKITGTLEISRILHIASIPSISGIIISIRTSWISSRFIIFKASFPL